MPYRQQFRAYAEFFLRAAELSDSPEQKADLVAAANAWHQLAQDLELRDELANPDITAKLLLHDAPIVGAKISSST